MAMITFFYACSWVWGHAKRHDSGPFTRLCLTVLVAIYVAAAGGPAAAADLPVVCSAGACGVNGPGSWVSSGAATQSVTSTPTGARMDIRQTTNKAVLNWAEFNIGATNSVNFDQPSASALAINRIFQNSPSQIFGKLTANGQVYLINQNGVLFGGGAKVNVASLVASSLEITDQAVENGILDPQLLAQGRPAFSGDGRVFGLDQNGQVVMDGAGHPIPVKVVVEEGASISSSADGSGRVMLIGQKIENAGTIESKNGQVVLAAGEKVYLQGSTDPELRGLLVEVDAGGEVWNQLTGNISTPQGNATLVGMAVNQDGRVAATTSVRVNGSIRLLARDTVSVVNNGGAINVSTNNAGTVHFGAGSTTEVLPDASDEETAVDEQAQSPSRVEVMGRQIGMQAGSTIRVPGGEVSLTALPNPSITRPTDQPLPKDEESLITLEAGSRIDVSGSAATTSVTRNLVEVDLRANELRDSPLQRDGALRGKTVVVDARVGTPLADVSGALANVKRDVLERTSAGGTVSLQSQGNLVVAASATVDVSGGSVTYTGGVVQTSKLVTADGKIVDIGDADPDRVYRGIVQPSFQLSTGQTVAAPGIGLFDPGYVDGKDAGTISLSALGMTVNGTLTGHAMNGVYQRDPSNRTLGGSLVIGDPNGQGLRVPDFRAPSVRFVAGPVSGPESPADELSLSTDYLEGGGFTRTAIYSNGIISVPSDVPLTLAAGSTFALRGSVVDVAAGITAPGGDIRLSAVDVNPAVALSAGRRPGVVIADGVSISADGVWVNDTPEIAANPQAPLSIDGGRVDLSVQAQGGELVLGDGVRLSAEGGAWLNGSGDLLAGNGGSVAIQARGANAALETGNDLDLSAWSLTRGGSLTISANQIRISADRAANAGAQRSDPLANAPVPFELGTSLFTAGGFQNFRVVATGGRLADVDGAQIEPLTVAANANIEPHMQVRLLDAGYRQRVSGSSLAEFTTEILPAVHERMAADVSLIVQPHSQVTPATAGDLVLEAGSRIATDPSGLVELASTRRIVVDGAVLAPGGRISARLGATPNDLGFDPDVGIYVGATGLLNAAGATILVPDDAGLRRGTVLDGGSIQLTADRGTIQLSAGSTLDVSGAAADLDVVAGTATVSRRTVASRGGTISLLAPEGMRLDGALHGASGGSGSERPEGGTLDIGISRLRGWNPGDSSLLATYPTNPRQILLSASPRSEDGAPDGMVRLDPGLVAAGHFDNLTLQADDAIVFGEDLTLAVGNRMALEAPNLRALDGVGTVHLDANALSLGPRFLPGIPAPATAEEGPATLQANAGLIDLFDDLALQGFGAATLESRSDIRFSGSPRTTVGQLTGSFSSSGELTLRAAQLYPTTYTNFAVTVAPDAGGRINIFSNGQTAGPVLAGAGGLAFHAADIVNAGVVKAPLGQITFDAVDSLTLASGSVTSTTAAGQTIPFGQVVAGTNWVYESIAGSLASVTTPPTKRVTLSADEVRIENGATMDVSGGGDLQAYEFVPGPGGSVDALSPSVNPNLFAILPNSSATFSAYDAEAYLGSTLKPGDSIYLTGVPGVVAAGNYALLPARYALLPGAMLVEAVDGTTDIVPGAPGSLRDGTPVVAGYRSVAGTSIRDSRSTGFAVRPGSYARELAEYRDSFAGKFFADAAAAQDKPAPRLPRDAGDVRVAVGAVLDFDGILNSAAGTGGRGSRIDISADNLEIVAALGSAALGVVQVDAAALRNLGAASLLLGGTREFSEDATDLTPTATTVTLAENIELTGPEVLLVARERVALDAGAALVAEGSAAAGAAETVRIAGADGSALLRVSRNAQVAVERAAGAAATGDIAIAAGARVAAAGSVTVDAAGIARSFGEFDVSGAALSLGSRRIVLGDSQSNVSDGLALSNETLAGLSDVSELRLAASDRIDFGGAVTVGTPAGRPDRLILDTGLLSGGGADATLNAADVLITGSGAASGGALASGTGIFQIVADRLNFGRGSSAISGFATVELQGRTGATTADEFTLTSGSDLTIAAPVIVGTAGSSLAIRAPDRSVVLTTGASPADARAALGAALDIEAGTILADTALIFPSGRIRLAADQGLTLGSQSSLDASGRRQILGNASVVTAAGDVTLIARTGDVTQSAGSRIDVSAGDAQGEAGSLSVFAGDAAGFAGELSGGGSNSAHSGTFRLVTADAGDFALLNSQLNDAGFNLRREIETTAGDLTIGAGVTVRADQLTLAASGGSLSVQGTIDAAAAGGGRVVLAARDDVSLAAGSHVDAGNSAAAGRGGEVSILSTAGMVDLAAGSEIDVNGPDGADTGSVLLRAAATGDDVNITGIAADIRGAREVVIEPVLAQAIGDTIDAGAITGFRSLLTDYMAGAAAAIRARLGLDGILDVIRPGLDLVGTGDVTLNSEWNFNDWRFDGQPGYLTIRAPGQLNISADISDGFVRGGTVAAPTLTLLDGPTWSYRLVGGAAADSTLPWATRGRFIDEAESGGVRLADNHVVRTGTGSIVIAADSDLALAGRGSLIYTAGVPAKPQTVISVNGIRFARNWVRDGGDITLLAGRDVTAVASAQIMSGWNVRGAGSTGQAEWSVDFTRFRQGVAAMAGGDVRISAGRDISNLSASVLTTSGERPGEPGVYDAWGGGDLDISAGRDVLSGVFGTWQGDGRLTAGRSIVSGNRVGSSDIHTIVSHGLGNFAVSARRDLNFGGAINPTAVASANFNVGGAYFYTYAPTDALRLSAIGGDLRLVNSAAAFAAVVGPSVASITAAFSVYPASVYAAAPSGNIEFLDAMYMLPSAQGQLEFLAAGSIRAPGDQASLVMSDVNPATVPTAAAPVGNDQILVSVQRSSFDAIHIGDADPVRLVAATGDISGGNYKFSKQFGVFAARDISSAFISGQNTDAQQISLVQAGRDIALPEASNGIELGGPGRLAVLAGRNLDLGFSEGITSLGRTVNAQLPGSSGASVDVWAGVSATPGFAAFSDHYWNQQYEREFAAYVSELLPFVQSATGRMDLDQDNVWGVYAGLTSAQKQSFVDGLPPENRIAFASFENLVTDLVSYTSQATGRDDLTPSNANEAYLGLDIDRQRPLIQEFFFRELRDAGREANQGLSAGDSLIPARGFERGDMAVETLFPEDAEYAGDMSLVFSRIYTLAGGDINLLAPGGLLNVGLATLPANLSPKKPSELGIVAQGIGAVSIFADGDVLVNQSRVFTLGGGDIVIWSTEGDIDAGRGSKSAISAPPPTVTVDSTGKVNVEFSDAIAGSGIRSIETSVPPGDVDLIAQNGEVNAGDAGIGGGNVSIAAVQVVGLDNINVGGEATGFTPDTGAIAPPAAAATTTTSATDSAESAAAEASQSETPLAEAALGWLEVFVEGFGEPGTQEDEDEKKKRKRVN